MEINGIALNENETRSMNSRKATFVARSEKEVSVKRCLAKKLEEAKSVLADFDNKIINKRIVTKLQNEIGEDDRYYFSLKHEGSIIPLTISMPYDRTFNDHQGHFGGYIGDNTCTVYLEYQEDYILSKGNRFDYEKTAAGIDWNIAALNSQIEKLIDCIDNFDKYYTESIKIERTIDEYKRNVPYQLRQNITVSGWAML